MRVRVEISYDFSDEEREMINRVLFLHSDQATIRHGETEGPGLASREILKTLIHQLGDPETFRDESFVCATKRLKNTTWNELLGKRHANDRDF